MVCGSISSFLGAACARQRGHLEANSPYRSREQEGVPSRVWDHFRPVISVDECPRCRKSVSYCFSTRAELGFHRRSWAEWAAQRLFVCNPLNSGERNLRPREPGRCPLTMPVWESYPLSCASILQYRYSSWQRPPGNQRGKAAGSL